MRLLGVNKGWTCSSKILRNGGAGIYDDGHLTALSEERISGKKYAPGYEHALRALLSSKSLSLSDFDMIGISTCCETQQFSLVGHPLADHPHARSINHHESHAALAFYASGFEKALVVVIDGGGNVLSRNNGQPPSVDWWTESREQHSYYLATRTHGLELIDRDFVEPYAIGLGEMYRAFTHYLGWHSSTNSSRTMALAGHGRRKAIKGELYQYSEGSLSSPIRNDPNDPIGMITELARVLDLDFGEPRPPGGAILQIHKDVASFVQEQCERVLLARLDSLAKVLKVEKLCLSGGFALNVVANGRLHSKFPGGTYVPSAPGDEGQCLGNIYVMLGEQDRQKGHKMPAIMKSADAFLGPVNKVDSKSVAYALTDTGHSSYIVFETSDFSDLVARMLASGSVVCIYQERAEFGPRALGARSILADPRRLDAVSRLNNLKSREWFMPFAPAVLREKMAAWFTPVVESPFMSFAVNATPRAAKELPAVLNADDTSRVQTVGPDDAGPLRNILLKFAEHTQIPVLLNTSFNLGGEPIVETVQQAIESFGAMPINALGIGRFVVVKSLSPDLGDLPVSATISDLEMEAFKAANSPPEVISHTRPNSRIRMLQKLTSMVIFVRTELPLYGEYLNWVREGRKVTTIRLRKGAVEVPFSSVLPLFETADFGPGDRSRPTEYVKVSALRYHRWGDLSADDAKRDGFKSYEDMRQALTKIYPHITDEDWVTVYDISLIQSGNENAH